ncbi:hypothetical protein [Bradyrhizobium sp. ARR65]|uniref:DUF2946 family protein n=1 Tax=Bradyrhizobium sp. ARR65 TaxID=1040989 RepID=UPI0004675793|nr:hypothetical protein [Bradyrhizobium sp. ARR65]
MRWVRDNIRHGSWLALVALAINFALSFGHVHAIAGRASRGVIVAALALPEQGKTQGHPDEGQADYLCPICIATSAIANALASSPPAILLQLTATAVDRTIEPARFVVEPQRAAFQSRGPPIS